MVSILRTPGNIVGASIERMPFLGANRILRSYREALAKGGAEAELAKAKAVMGWGLWQPLCLLDILEFLADLMLLNIMVEKDIY